MSYASVVTLYGKNRALSLLFGGGGTAFGYIGVGTGVTTPTEASETLNTECTEAAGDYVRLALTSTFPGQAGGVNKKVTSEATFDVDNITNETNITELAIYDNSSGGKAFCICQIPPTLKTSAKKVKFIITNSVA